MSREDLIGVSVAAQDSGNSDSTPFDAIERAALQSGKRRGRTRTLSATGERYARLLTYFIVLIFGFAGGCGAVALVVFVFNLRDSTSLEIGLFCGLLVGLVPGIFLARYLDTRLFGYNASA